MGNRPGFTLIETLFSLVIAIIIVTTCASILQVVEGYDITHIENKDIDLVTFQLAHQLMISNSHSISNNQLKYNRFKGDGETLYETQDFVVYFDKNRLVKTIGYEIMLENIDGANFVCDEGLKMVITRNNTTYHRLIHSECE